MPNEILDETANFPSVIYFQVYLKLDFKPVHEKAQVFLFNKELEPKDPKLGKNKTISPQNLNDFDVYN